MTGNRNLLNIIKEIKDDTGEDTLILVEGKRDKEALEKVGILPSKILAVSYRDKNSIYSIMERDGKHRIIPLYDNDRTGNSKMKMLKAFFYGLGIDLIDYRKRLGKNGITYIEEIDNRLNL